MLDGTNNSTIVCVVVLLILILVHHGKKARVLYYGFKLNGPFVWPLIGNGLLFLGNTKDFLNTVIKLAEKFKLPYRLFFGTEVYFFVSEPKDMEIVLNSPHTLKKGDVYKFTEKVVGNGLFTAPVHEWKRNRKIISTSFNPRLLNNFVQVFAEQSEILVKKLETFCNIGFFDIQPVVNRCTLDFVCETNLGIKLNIQSAECKFIRNLGKVLELVYCRVTKIWQHPDFIYNLTLSGKLLNESCQQIHDFTETIIKRKRNEYLQRKACPEIIYQEEVTKFKPVLDHLITLAEEGANFSIKQIRDEVNTITIAATDALASMCSFALIMLGLHQDIQLKVYQELQTIFDDSNQPAACEDLVKMVYLERVIKETLRLFPVGPVILRTATEDVKLDTCLVPKGAAIALCIIDTHRNPNYWKDPLKFDPDRFLPGEIAKRHPYAWIPFSGGPRNCIGIKYAMLGMKTLLSTVLRKYKSFTNYKSVEEIKIKADLMIKASDGYFVALEKRN